MRKNKIKIFLFILSILMCASLLGVSGAFATTTGWDPNALDDYGLPTGSVYNIIKEILNWILGIIGFVGVISFAIAGIMYLVSAGNDDTVKKAKSAMKYAIIGVIVALSGVVAIQAVDQILNGNALW